MSIQVSTEAIREIGRSIETIRSHLDAADRVLESALHLAGSEAPWAHPESDPAAAVLISARERLRRVQHAVSLAIVPLPDGAALAGFERPAPQVSRRGVNIFSNAPLPQMVLA